MRSIAGQDVVELGGTWSVLVRQKRDHVELDQLLDDLQQTDGVHDEQVLQKIARLVFPHAFAEEAVLWPLLRRMLPDGEALTLQVEQEHQEVNELWTEMERRSVGSPARRRVATRVIEVLRQDVRDEEDQLLPQLQASLDARALRRAGITWEVVRRIAPTRPHPLVSRRPPGNILSATGWTHFRGARREPSDRDWWPRATFSLGAPGRSRA
jgi:hemerythrin superfamily protein